MAESRAADYIAHGLNSGINRFFEMTEKRKEEEKREAKEFKALADFAEASGLLSKDQAVVMDKDSLKGFVQGKMWAKEQERQNQESAIREFAAMQKMAEFQQMQQKAAASQGFQTDFNNSMATSPNLAAFYENPEQFAERPMGDPLAAFQSALARNPQVDPSDLNTFMSGFDKAVPPMAKQWAPTELEKELAAQKRAEAEGRKSDAAMHAQRAAKLNALSKGIRMVSPDGTVMEVGGEADGVTQGTQGKLEQSVNGTRKTLELVDDLVQNLDWKDVGFAGVIGEGVLDKLLPQFGVNSLNPKRVDNRTKLKTMIQGALRQISPDNRFTNEDRKRIEDIMPSTGVFENEKHAKEVLATIQRVFAKRNVQDLMEMGKPITLESLAPAEIGAAVEMGLINYEEAREYLLQRPN